MVPDVSVQQAAPEMQHPPPFRKKKKKKPTHKVTFLFTLLTAMLSLSVLNPNPLRKVSGHR